MYKTCERSVLPAVFSPVVWVATQGAGVSAMLVSDFRAAGTPDIEHEADVFAINCLESITCSHDNDGNFRMT